MSDLHPGISNNHARGNSQDCGPDQAIRRSSRGKQLRPDLKKGDLNGLIGPNGAGKTTVFNMITGVYVPTNGEIQFRGQNITGIRTFPDQPDGNCAHVPEHPPLPEPECAG